MIIHILLDVDEMGMKILKVGVVPVTNTPPPLLKDLDELE